MKKIIPLLSLLFLTVSLFSGCEQALPPVEVSCDVLVIGSDPEGIAAALAAARGGADTVLIDTRDRVGGLFTLGWLNFLDMNYGPERELLTRGIFAEFFDQVEGIAFDVPTAQRVFNDMLAAEPNLTLMLSASDYSPEVEGAEITALSCGWENRQYSIRASYYIDATQNGDIGAAAGVPHTLGLEDIGGPSYGMAVTQVFKLGGVKDEDWGAIRRYLRDDGDVNSGSTNNTAWGFASFYDDYRASQENVQLRGLNIARQTDSCLMINALQIFAIDPLNPDNIELAREKATSELEHIIPFLRESVPGMQNVTLLSTAPELYIRESRHFATEYTLTIDDVLEHRCFEDRIAMGSYPVDLQGAAPGADVIILGNPKLYSIPLRSIIPVGIDNLLIAGRCAGYSSLAHGSARMVPVGMCTAEAAGTLAVQCMETDSTPRSISGNKEAVSILQQTLVSKGGYLPEFDLSPAIADSPHYEGLKLLRFYGLIDGRYNNDYRLDAVVSVKEFNRALTILPEQRGWNLLLSEIPAESELTRDTVLAAFAQEGDIAAHFREADFWARFEESGTLRRAEFCDLFLELDRLAVR